MNSAEWEQRMIREISLFGIAAMVLSLAMADVSSDNASWVATSNGYTKMLLDVRLKHRPEIGTNQGLSQYDDKVSQPTLEDEDRERQETAAVLAKLKSAVAEQKQKEVAEDLQIMIRDTELRFRIEDFERAHQVPKSKTWRSLPTISRASGKLRPISKINILEFRNALPAVAQIVAQLVRG